MHTVASYSSALLIGNFSQKEIPGSEGVRTRVCCPCDQSRGGALPDWRTAAGPLDAPSSGGSFHPRPHAFCPAPKGSGNALKGQAVYFCKVRMWPTISFT